MLWQGASYSNWLWRGLCGGFSTKFKKNQMKVSVLVKVCKNTHNTYKDNETRGSLIVWHNRQCCTKSARMLPHYACHSKVQYNTIQTVVKAMTACIVTCSVDDNCLLPLVIIPCRATGCCGMSIFTAPTVSSPEFLSLARLEMLEYRACDLPTVTFTTVLKKQ